MARARLFDVPKKVTKSNSSGNDVKQAVIESTDDEALLRVLNNIKSDAITYRNNFKNDWTEVENQINCVPPAEWDDKEEWQTKIFIPEQFKISETASAMMLELLGFTGRRQFFTVMGIESEDRQVETDLVRFIDIILNDGKFYVHNGYVLQEAINLGTSLIKFLDAQNRTGIDFSFRKITTSAVDPNAVVSLDDGRYVIEEYNEDIADIMVNQSYSKDARNKLLLHLQNKTESSGKQEDLVAIANAEGSVRYQIDREFTKVGLIEYWGEFPIQKEVTQGGKLITKFTKEWRAITVADENVILRDDENPVEFLPYQWCRTKRRRNHPYANGFCRNLIGLQDLANSLINLGFDSAKIKSLGIVKVAEADVADASSIEFRPLAKWYMKPDKMDAASLEYLGENRMNDIVKTLSYADQLVQDASGVTRQFQGAAPAFERQETLGQTQIKMAAAEKRFMKIAQEVTEDYIIPLITKIFKHITHPKFVGKFQKLADEKIGTRSKIIELAPISPGEEPVRINETQSKLDLKSLGKMNLDFKPIGIVNFLQKAEAPKQMTDILNLMASDPTMNLILAKEKVLARLFQVSSIEDAQDLFRSPAEREQMRAILEGAAGGSGQGGPDETGAEIPNLPQQPAFG